VASKLAIISITINIHIEFIELQFRLIGIMDINVIERLIPFPGASVRVSGLETGVKVSWELNQLPLGELEIAF
jgi:hypothetical protein